MWIRRRGRRGGDRVASLDASQQDCEALATAVVYWNAISLVPRVQPSSCSHSMPCSSLGRPFYNVGCALCFNRHSWRRPPTFPSLTTRILHCMHQRHKIQFLPTNTPHHLTQPLQQSQILLSLFSLPSRFLGHILRHSSIRQKRHERKETQREDSEGRYASQDLIHDLQDTAGGGEDAGGVLGADGDGAVHEDYGHETADCDVGYEPARYGCYFYAGEEGVLSYAPC